MSAFAYINIEDVPANLREGAGNHTDDVNKANLIAFEGCPLVGEVRIPETLNPGDPVAQVEYPFPRNAQIRNDLVAWFVHHGINFTVVM